MRSNYWVRVGVNDMTSVLTRKGIVEHTHKGHAGEHL